MKSQICKCKFTHALCATQIVVVQLEKIQLYYDDYHSEKFRPTKYIWVLKLTEMGISLCLQLKEELIFFTVILRV